MFPSPPDARSPQPAPPVNPAEAADVLVSQAVGSLNAAMEAAKRLTGAYAIAMIFSGEERLVVNVWGVGYWLMDGVSAS